MKRVPQGMGKVPLLASWCGGASLTSGPFSCSPQYFQDRLIVGNCSANGKDGNWTSQDPGPAAPCRDDFNFGNWLALLSQLPLLLFTLLNSLLYPCIPDKVRILGSLAGILVLFVLTATLVRVEMPPARFFSITMASVWFINSFCAILQGSLFGQLGSFPQSYSTVFLSGQGMAGTFATTAMLLSLASGLDAQTSALSYFVTPCVGTLISIVCYLVLPYKVRRGSFVRPRGHGKARDGPLRVRSGDANQLLFSPQDFARHHLDKSREEEPVCELEMKTGLLSPGQWIWQLALSIILVFSITLSVFPAITASVSTVSENKTWQKFFTPVCCFLLFNIMDWLGRSATSYFSWPEKHLRLLPGVVGLRLFLVPLFLFCNVSPRASLPLLFRQDAWFVLFMLVFSLSNGYFVSLSMCLAPKQVQPHESELAGAIMTFFLALGLSCGAGLSFALKALL
uniref:Solute carrier family 29 member 2 n=1 Tax=Varanus komodoensis TaxID=61221 RepID=A0A8D2Q599_VARKO